MSRPPSSPSATPSFSRAVSSLARSLLVRPLVWLGFCVLLGVMLGGQCAHIWRGLAREEAPLWWFLPVLLGGIAIAWGARRSPWASRLGVAVAVVVLFAGYTTRRLLPPRNDISRQFANPAKRDEPLRNSPVRVVGIIGDYPQFSRFNVRFPFDVETVNGRKTAGRIWVSASFNSHLEVGDRLELRTNIRPILHPTNPGEREDFWSALRANCWCESGPLLELHVVKPGAAYALERRIQGIRRALLTRYEAMFAGDGSALPMRPFPRHTAALLTAMVWGEGGLREPLPQQTRDDFRASGLSHLLVSSGTQVRATVPAYLIWEFTRTALLPF